MEALIRYILWTLIITYPFIEGIREFYFYGLNKSGNFSQRSKDVNRKYMYIVTWAFAHALPIIELSHNDWLVAGLLTVTLAWWRWIVLDGVLNLKRDKGFMYAGGSGRSFTDNLLYPLSIPGRIAFKFIPLILSILLIIWLL